MSINFYANFSDENRASVIEAIKQHYGVDAPLNVLNDVLYGDLETLRNIDLGNSRNYRQCVVDLDPMFQPEDGCFPNFGHTYDKRTIREILLVAFDAPHADELLPFIHSINWS